MAKRRTKKQKMKAKLRMTETVKFVDEGFKVKTEEVKQESEKSKPEKSETTEEVKAKKLIVKDLVKTGIFALILLLILLSAYFSLR